jgi:hypothetical protein
MTTSLSTNLEWKTIGTSKTSPLANTERKEVRLDVFYLVVGFEVNNADAFTNNIHDLAVDYGHAFYYLVQNLIIIQSFSFGPQGRGKIGWFDMGARGGKRIYTMGAIKKDGSTNSRPSTADYKITETVKAFKITLTEHQAKKLNEKTNEARAEIYKGQINYTAFVNDTCAETAKEILDDSAIPTPDGDSWIKHSDLSRVPIAHAVNPYKWHKEFKSKYKETIFHLGDLYEWLPLIGAADPIYSSSSLSNDIAKEVRS